MTVLLRFGSFENIFYEVLNVHSYTLHARRNCLGLNMADI